MSQTYFAILFTSKLSLAAIFLRLFGPKPVLRYLIYVGICFAGAVSIIGLLGGAISCRPTGLEWLACVKTQFKFNFIASCLNIVCDVYFLVLPMIGIGMLQMQKGQKLAVSVVFCTGLL